MIIRPRKNPAELNAEIAEKIAAFKVVFIPYPKHMALHVDLDYLQKLGRKTIGQPQMALRALGPSGSGKSAATLAYIAAVERKRPRTATFVPVLKVDLERGSTPKKLMMSILLAFGDLHAGYGNELALKTRVFACFQRFGTELLIVDEFQHLNYRSGIKNDVTDTLKGMLDAGVVPMHWDLLQRPESDARAAFHNAFRRIAHNSNVPIVRSELTRLNLEAGYLPTSARGRKWQPAPEMTAAAAADTLGVTPGALKQLVEAKMLTPLRTRGARHTIKFYAEEDIEALKAVRGQGVSCRWFRAASTLPAIAVEQLVALGHLEFCRDPVAALLYGNHQLRADMADQMIERIRALPLPPTADGWIALSEAFMGVGGREKPWGPVIAAGLNGRLPGGLINGAVMGTPVFMISSAVANSLVMGGPSASPWFSFEPDHYGDLRRDWFSPGETVSYLNCSAVEISYLIDKGRLHPLAREGLTRFARTEVEEFGRVWMNTREAAARLGVTPHRVWRELEPYRLEWSLGRGFHKRDELEPIVEREVQERRLQAFGLG